MSLKLNNCPDTKLYLSLLYLWCLDLTLVDASVNNERKLHSKMIFVVSISYVPWTLDVELRLR